jgi:hypothetical protein
LEIWEEVLKDQKRLRTWGSEIGGLGRCAERLEMFQNMGSEIGSLGTNAEGLHGDRKLEIWVEILKD